MFCQLYLIPEAKFTVKYLCWSLFLVNLQVFIKKRLRQRRFPAKFATFLRAPILKNISERLISLREIIFSFTFNPFSDCVNAHNPICGWSTTYGQCIAWKEV